MNSAREAPEVLRRSSDALVVAAEDCSVIVFFFENIKYLNGNTQHIKKDTKCISSKLQEKLH